MLGAASSAGRAGHTALAVAVTGGLAGLGIALVFGEPVVTAGLAIWRETVIPAFLELHLAGFLWC